MVIQVLVLEVANRVSGSEVSDVLVFVAQVHVLAVSHGASGSEFSDVIVLEA